MQIGFTGTQEGMSKAQYHVISKLLDDTMAEVGIEKVRHGMCIGADLAFHDMCRNKGLYIVGHPGVSSRGTPWNRAVCDVDEIEPEYPYLVRNQHIVENSDVLFATPKEEDEQMRSGTWATIRRARTLSVPHLIIGPTGLILEKQYAQGT